MSKSRATDDPASLLGKFLRQLILATSLLAGSIAFADIWNDVEHGYADNDGVRIHYAVTGDGPLVVMIHGFPDFWYSWRHQMQGLKNDFRVAAMDTRGYNLSDQPQGQENYDMALLVSDVIAVVHDLGYEEATIVGHDWGGAIAWNVAFARPDVVRKLIILDLPHPRGLATTWANNEEALANTAYARTFRAGSPDDPNIFFGGPMTAESISGWVTDEAARQKYIEAFERSDFRAMLNYYKQNYPDLWSDSEDSASLSPPDVPNIEIPTLIFHGLQDQALHSDALNNTWDWIDSDLTIVTAPEAGHFIQQDAAELVTTTMRWWLLSRP